MGVGQMGALETRAALQTGGDGYPCPLAEIPLPPAVLAGYLKSVATADQPLTCSTRSAVEAIVTRYCMQSLLAVQYTERMRKHSRLRYGSRPATVPVECDIRVKIVVDRPAVAAAVGRLD
jgi:hypothetical protein